MRRLLPAVRCGTGPVLRIAGAAGQGVVLAGAAVFTAAVFLLLLSAFRHEAVGSAARIAAVGVAALSLLRPDRGLLILAAGIALAEVVGPLLGSRLRNAELFILAGLAGTLLRGWWSGAVRRFPQGRLETAVAVFGLVIAASYLEQLWFQQIQRDFPLPFLRGLWSYASAEYLVGFSRHGGTIFAAMLLLEGLALLVWGTRLCRRDPAFAGRLTNAVAIGGIATAAVSLLLLVAEFAERGLPVSSLPAYLFTVRWAVHVRDVNAAASYFGLVFLLASGRALFAERHRPLWFAGTLLVATAFLVTQSRTVFVAVVITAACAVVWGSVKRRSWRRAVAVAATAGLLSIGYVLSQDLGRGGSAYAVYVRLGFLATTARMLGWQPMSGVGVGQFNLWSQHFSSPTLRRAYNIENAHNNFAQIAGELGLPGLLALLLVLAFALARWRGGSGWTVARTDRLALLGFLATWLGNHPMLLAPVAYPFWILLGSASDPRTAGGAHAPHQTDVTPALRAIVLAAAVLLTLSVPMRVESKSEAIDWTDVRYGFHAWEGPPESRFRWMTRHARFYLPAEVGRFRLPVRALADDSQPMRLDLFVEGRLASRVEMRTWDVHTLEHVLPGTPALGAWQIDLVASRSFVPAEVSPGNQDTRELSVMVSAPELFDRRNVLIREGDAEVGDARQPRPRVPNPMLQWRMPWERVYRRSGRDERGGNGDKSREERREIRNGRDGAAAEASGASDAP